MVIPREKVLLLFLVDQRVLDKPSSLLHLYFLNFRVTQSFSLKPQQIVSESISDPLSNVRCKH